MRCLLVIALLGAAGCVGGFDNQFLEGTGGIRGQLTGASDYSGAWVTILGQPEFTDVDVAADGSYELRDLPGGDSVVLAMDGAGRAARLETQIVPDQMLHRDLELATGGNISGTIELEFGRVAQNVRVAVAGVALLETVADTNGDFLIVGVPLGECYDLVVSAEGYETAIIADMCPTQPGLVQAPSLILAAIVVVGHCSPCATDGDCVGDLVCATETTSGVPESFCTTACPGGTGDDDDGPACDCPAGFRSTQIDSGERACVPATASCTAFVAAGSGLQCQNDAECSLPGLTPDGVCRQGNRCAVPCSDDWDCPASQRCRNGQSVDYCD